VHLLGPRLSRVPSWCSLSLPFSSLVTGAHNDRSQRLPRNLPPGRGELHPPKGGLGGGDRRELRYLPGDADASDPVLALRLLTSLSGTPFSSHPQRFDLATQLRFAQPLLVTLVYELEIHHPTHPGFSSFRRLIRPSLCTFAHSTPRRGQCRTPSHTRRSTQPRGSEPRLRSGGHPRRSRSSLPCRGSRGVAPHPDGRPGLRASTSPPR